MNALTLSPPRLAFSPSMTTAGTASARFREFGSTGDRVVLEEPVKGKLTCDDSCYLGRYLGRYNGVYDSLREILSRIPPQPFAGSALSAPSRRGQRFNRTCTYRDFPGEYVLTLQSWERCEPSIEVE